MSRSSLWKRVFTDLLAGEQTVSPKQPTGCGFTRLSGRKPRHNRPAQKRQTCGFPASGRDLGNVFGLRRSKLCTISSQQTEAGQLSRGHSGCTNIGQKLELTFVHCPWILGALDACSEVCLQAFAVVESSKYCDRYQDTGL
ncbi:hypothetical protein BaRGS_00006044 [Batillaria attramentaria]|uniref:Uncharacterized protein n=1 Tax=Batillaria attramentaria TaxID=370345 RepID=A0ABD0LUV1_9CAEN